MFAEAAGGLLSGSLALVGRRRPTCSPMRQSLGLLGCVPRIAAVPATRQADLWVSCAFQVLAAYSNGLTLALLALAIVYAAIMRLHEPIGCLAGLMLAIA